MPNTATREATKRKVRRTKEIHRGTRTCQREQCNAADDAERDVYSVVGEVRALPANVEFKLFVLDVEDDGVETGVEVEAPREDARGRQIDSGPRDGFQKRIRACGNQRERSDQNQRTATIGGL